MLFCAVLLFCASWVCFPCLVVCLLAGVYCDRRFVAVCSLFGNC